MRPRSLEACLLGTTAVDSPRADRPAALVPPKPHPTPPIDYRSYELPNPEPAP